MTPDKIARKETKTMAKRDDPYYLTFTFRDVLGNQVAMSGVSIEEMGNLIEGKSECTSDHDGNGRCGNKAVAFTLPATAGGFPFPVGTIDVMVITKGEHDDSIARGRAASN